MPNFIQTLAVIDSKMTRTPNNLCLLCKENKATKTKSHIASKFLGKSILGTENQKVAYEIDTSIPSKRPRKVQDSPKEDFIVCPECEKYFEILETYCANNLHGKILNPENTLDFQSGLNNGGLEHTICISLDDKILRLFVYSLFWRASVSQTKIFQLFKMHNDEILRQILTYFKSNRIEDIEVKSELSNTFELELVILRAKSRTGSTQNIITAQSGDPYLFYINEYIFVLGDKHDNISRFEHLVNKGKGNIIIGLIDQSSWDKFTFNLINYAAFKTQSNSNKAGMKKPWWLENK